MKSLHYTLTIDISKSPTTENSVHIINVWWCPPYFNIEFIKFFNANFSKKRPVDVKHVNGHKITWLETAVFVLMGGTNMCTQSTAFKDAVDMKHVYGCKITWLETATFVLMGDIRMYTQSTALTNAV
jgi:hypothetical protein